MLAKRPGCVRLIGKAPLIGDHANVTLLARLTELTMDAFNAPLANVSGDTAERLEQAVEA